MPLTELNFITGNANKLSEVKAILGNTVHVRSQSLDLPEIQGSIEEVSSDKCQRAAEAVGGPVLTEDVSLCFGALKGLPGPYMSVFVSNLEGGEELRVLQGANRGRKWFLTALGHEGLNNMLLAYEDKSAEAVCTFAYSQGPGDEPILFQGRTLGKIVPARGTRGFGFDPIFECEGITYAEMDKVEKNKISHRFKGLQKLKEWLETRD